MFLNTSVLLVADKCCLLFLLLFLLFLLILHLHLLVSVWCSCVYVCMFTQFRAQVYAGMFVCKCMWGPEVNVRDLPPLLLTLFF